MLLKLSSCLHHFVISTAANVFVVDLGNASYHSQYALPGVLSICGYQTSYGDPTLWQEVRAASITAIYNTILVRDAIYYNSQYIVVGLFIPDCIVVMMKRKTFLQDSSTSSVQTSCSFCCRPYCTAGHSFWENRQTMRIDRAR